MFEVGGKGEDKHYHNGGLEQHGERQVILKHCWTTWTGKEKSEKLNAH
jgi:hypothetical protein